MKKSLSVLLIIMVLFCFCAVTVNAEPSAAVVLSRDSIVLYPNQTYKLLLTYNNSEVKFTTSNNNIAEVSPDGTVTAISSGNATITAESTNGSSSQCSVEVKSGVSPEDVVIDTQSLTLTVGSGKSISASVYPKSADDTQIHYSSSDSSVATVSDKGYINAVGMGVAVISAESSSSAVSKQCMVKVVSKPYGNSDFSASVDGTLYSLSGEHQKGIIVELRNNKINQRKTTDSNGYFSFENVTQGNYAMSLYQSEDTKNAFATASINVNSYGISMSCIINGNNIVVLYRDEKIIQSEIQDITLSKSTLTLDRGEEYEMAFTVRPASVGIPTLKCISSDESVVSVDSKGKITAVSKGNATVTFSTADGKISKSCNIIVTDINSSEYSWIIILIETIIALLIIVVFIYFYKRFLREKEKEEMGETGEK